MKTIIINTCLIFLTISLFGQAGINITNGVQIVCTDEVQFVLKDMQWNNEGQISASESTLSFIGATPGTAAFEDALFNTYNDINIRRPGTELLLHSDIDMEGDIIFQSGNLNLNNQTVSLLDISGDLELEHDFGYAYGPIGGQMIAGELLTFPDNENPGNLGAVITAGGDLSYTEVRRGHGLYLTPGGHSVSRWYSIYSAMGVNVPTVLQLQYFDHELNGLDEGLLQVWNSTDYGISWTMINVIARSTADNWVQVFGEGLNGLFTLSLPGNSLSPEGGEALGQTGSLPSQPILKSFTAYPNPTVDQIQVNVETDTEEQITFQWVDALGKIVRSKEVMLEAGQNNLTFDIVQFAAGTYFLKTNNPNWKALTIIKMP